MGPELALVLVASAVVAGAALWRRQRMPRAVLRPDGTQEATFIVRGEYRPKTIGLVAGVPAVLRFDRQEEDACSERLVCELLPAEHRLAAHEVTTIRFTPKVPGTYAFACALGLYAGRLVVRAPHAARSFSRRRATPQAAAPGSPGGPRAGR